MKESRLTAIEHLFLDNDPATLAILKEQLLNQGDEVVSDLKTLSNADSMIVATHALDLLHTLAGRRASERLELLLDGTGEIPLEEEKCDPVTLLSGYLQGELGFKGCTEDYYHHENSILPSAITNRRGLPLTLSLLNMFLGDRTGITVHGVNLPGHFIVRCGETYFDPFHGGKILDRSDCEKTLIRQQIPLRDEYLSTL